MKLNGLILVLYILFCQELFSQDINFLKTDSMIRTRGEAYIAIPDIQLKATRDIPPSLIFDKSVNDRSYFYVNRESFRDLERSGLDYSYIIPPSLAGPIIMAKTTREVLNGSGYPTYHQYLAIMDSFRTTYPSICHIDTIGYSINGRLILSARLHTGKYIQGEKPVMMYSSSLHGDEPVGYVFLLMYLDEMLNGYGKDDHNSGLIDETIILVNPLANPDGMYIQSDTSISGAIRGNLNYVDLNRDFPDCREDKVYSTEGRQKETQVMMAYLEKYKPSISANFHTGAEVLNYPWDRKWNSNGTPSLLKYHSDMNWFITLCREYVDSARMISPDYLKSEFPEGFVMGTLWYQVTGGRQDFVTCFLGGREVTIELSSEKIPSATVLPDLWNTNRISIRNYLKQGLYGIYGMVKDSATNLPLRAKIYIPGHDSLNSFVFSDHGTGKFFRYLANGTYSLIAETDGYIPGRITGIEVIKNNRTQVEIRIRSVKNALTDQEILVVPNPFTNEFDLLFRTVTPEDTEIKVYNINGKLVYSTVFISVQGVNMKRINLEQHSSGIYILKLITESKTETSKIVKTE